jgi:hypothetical protein
VYRSQASYPVSAFNRSTASKKVASKYIGWAPRMGTDLPITSRVLARKSEKRGKSKNVRLQPACKAKNKAGMFMIINDFYFRNGLKAWMYMKKSKLSMKSWNVVDARWDNSDLEVRFQSIFMKQCYLSSYRR